MSNTLKVSRQDIIWGYFAQFFSIASGIIILPMVLRMLSAEEVGMNYLMLSVGQLVILVDFGFSPQFGRNVTYIHSGAQRLLKNGIEIVDTSVTPEINYSLLSALIQTARWIYRLMGGVVLFLMLTAGTVYVYRVTEGFNNISNSLLIWLIYSVSVFFQIYYSYYSALLTGSGKIKESKKAMVYSNLLKIILTYILLYAGYGLLGVVIANFIYPFLTRYLSYRYYFTPGLKQKISSYQVSISEKIDLFKTLWYNSKKLGITTLSGYLTYGASTLLAGIYLSLDEVASFGLMTQFVGLVGGISGIMFTIYQPRFASLRISGSKSLFRKEVAYTMAVFYLLYIVGTFLIVSVAPYAIRFIGSNTVLPAASIILFYAVFRLLDYNFWNLCQTVIAGNDFPFLKSCLLTGAGITIGCYVSLAWFELGLWGIVLSTGLVQSAYNNWHWPHVILKQMNINSLRFVKEGYSEAILRFCQIKESYN